MSRVQGQPLCGAIAAAAVLGVCIAAHTCADDVSDAEEPSSVVEPTDSRPQQVIVLTTGRVVLGDVVERPGGYLVREQFGSVVVPFTQVRLTATDLPDAYRKLSSSLDPPTAGKHLELAKWCYDNRLYSSAQIELKQSLLLEPERKDARELLRKLQRTMETGVHSGTASTGGTVSVDSAGGAYPGQAWKSYAQRREQIRSGPSTSIAGLSPETVQQYVKDVQPLLINKCGNARCHGQAAANDFRLTPVRQGMSGFRIFTEKNLSSILREIDAGNPDASPLLEAVRGLHGGSPRPLLVGAYADQQQAALRDWVLRAAVESNKRERVQGPASVVQNASAIEEDPIPIDDVEPAVNRSTLPRRDPFLEQILAEDRPDRFDPRVFNRMVHGQPTDSRRSRE